MEKTEEKRWTADQLRPYELEFEQIPRLHYKDPIIDELISQNVSRTALLVFTICQPFRASLCDTIFLNNTLNQQHIHVISIIKHSSHITH